MKIIQNSRRAAYGVAALLVGLGVALPEFAGSAFAASGAQVQSRSITMSSSAPGATGVSYKVTFTPQTTENGGEVIIDFCANSPIPGDTCTATAGTDVPDLTGVGGTNVTKVGSSNYHTAKVTGLTLTGTPTPAAVTITLTGITNPTVVGTSGNNKAGSFYARIFTYATGGAASYVPANGSVPDETGSVDYGGIALSTASVINVTAKVMETLSFCVYKASCGDDPSFQIGVGPNGTLDTNLATATTSFDVSTNASTGVVVDLKGDTLKNGSYTFATPSTSTPTAIAANAEGFGLAVTTPGGLQAMSPYNGTATTFALDTTSVKSTYGQKIASSAPTDGGTGPVQSSTSTITWGAQASNTTPAGIYTAAEQLIATGTY